MNHLYKRLSFLLFLIAVSVGSNDLWGQVSGTGIYYIINDNSNSYVKDKTTNWYLVPASEGGEEGVPIAQWTWNNDENTPLVTTFQTKKDNNSVWVVEQSGNYYRFIHLLSGQYITRNTGVGTNSNRRTFHMENTESLGDDHLFELTPRTGTNPLQYSIRPKGVSSNNKYMNPSNGNKAKYYAFETSDGGYMIGGTIGLYSKDAKDDPGSRWFFEAAKLKAPTINAVNESNMVTVSEINGLPDDSYQIRYTLSTEGEPADPTASSSTMPSEGLEITEPCILKVVIESHGVLLTDIVTKKGVAPYNTTPPMPQFTLDECINEFSIGPVIPEIYYTTNGSTPSRTTGTLYTLPFSQNTTATIKAISYYDNKASEITTFSHTAKTLAPTIMLDVNTVSISGNGDIYYTLNGDEPTVSSTRYTAPFTISSRATIKAIAKESQKNASCVTEFFAKPAVEINTLEKLNSILADDNCVVTDNIDATYFEGGIDNFSGTFNGGMFTISGLTKPLFNSINGGTVKNVILKDVKITTGDNVGAICGEATGASRIYNCGVLGTITVTTDTIINETTHEETINYTVEGTSEIGGSGNVGSIVGLLDGSSRVINCYSYAVITGGSSVGGIVGYNKVESEAPAADKKTMVMNCMFYGDITGGSSKAPIYNGYNITNVGKDKGVGNYNYFRAEARYVQDKGITVYNCALAAEERFLNRFEFFRHLLNSNRALAAWWATGSRDNKDDMMKWVLETADRTITSPNKPYPYPILKPVKDNNGKYIQYPSVVNIDATNAPEFTVKTEHKESPRNEGRKFNTQLTVKIRRGSKAQNQKYDAPSGAKILDANGNEIQSVDGTRDITLNITDKDPDRFNFNYYKVQLPYYNDYGTKNYTEADDHTGRVVTGWKIVSMDIEGSHAFSTGDLPADASASVNADGDITLTTPYNFADRKSTQKDIYASNGHRIFNQGAYFDVPEGVTSITIEPYWAKCVFVADEYLDVVCDQEMNNRYNVTTIGAGRRYENNKISIDGKDYDVKTTMGDAVSALNPQSSETVYDNAIVLVGNVHRIGLSSEANNKPFTIMSIDLDKDNEPDYSYILRFDGRKRVHPVRVDFLNVIGLGMAQKSDDGTGTSTGTYNFGIMQPYGWFECTNTGLFRVTQFEYDYGGSGGSTPRANSPMILHGGVIEQWVTVGGAEEVHVEAESVTYYHVGGNVWFKEFHIGVHQDKIQEQFVSPHPPISVTGGDFDEFYLTGLYNTPENKYNDNAECYINGGRFGKVAGTGMQGIGNAANHTGNIIWQIDNADIDEFYGGGINYAHVSEGNITTVISNSRVDQFCGGPKFGDMVSGTKVVTNATNCTFRTFFGAGYGGNSYNRMYPPNQNSVTNINWDNWIQNGYKTFGGYKRQYNSDYGGIDTRIDYQFIPMSDNTKNVARLFVDFISFSYATTHGVTSKLTGCTITTEPLGRLGLFEKCQGNFYGGGNLGKVTGPVNSTLINCTVDGSVFGAGYSATLPPVGVMNNRFQTQPYYDSNLGAYLEAKLPATETYYWVHSDTANELYEDLSDPDHPIREIRTTKSLDGLGSVTGDVTLTINGDKTKIKKSVYGGGEESSVKGNTIVSVDGGGTIGTPGNGGVEYGNVYGGGSGTDDDPEKGNVEGSTSVTISGNPTILHNVYGGGAYGSVGKFTGYGTNGIPTGWDPSDNKGKCSVTIKGGTIGVDGHNNGMVFGSSRGLEDYAKTNPLVDKLAWVYQTEVIIGDPNPEDNSIIQINGSVFGGGENGHNYSDSFVTINKGTIGIEGDKTIDEGDPDDPDDDVVDRDGPSYPSRGNVYGGGCGTDEYKTDDAEGNTPTAADDDGENKYYWYNPLAGVVGGNANITINGGHVVHNVYGAGAMGSVGIFTMNAETKKLECANNTGICKVTVNGGTIGTTGLQMITDSGYPDDWGYVFGAGRGNTKDPNVYPNIETVQFVDSTEVLITGTAFVTGSVYGGAENGHVLHSTRVTISGGQIGCGEGKTKPYTEAEWAAEEPSDFTECAHWVFGRVDDSEKGVEYKPYDVYDYQTGTTKPKPASDGHTFYGNVFGGGSGYYPYARRNATELEELRAKNPGYADGKWLRSAGAVGGNTWVYITGGHILTSVYGGNECTDVTGSCTIDMSGGTVGVPRDFDNNPGNRLVTCYVFGAGKGDQRINFNQWTNVDSTHVKISGSARIFGSTFGGGEDGHVIGNARTTIKGGEVKNGVQYPYIGTDGTSGADGNVFGGGRGYSEEALTAGVVCGDVYVNISGGTMLGSVFGGGRLAPVGTHIVLAESQYYGKLIDDDYVQVFGDGDPYNMNFHGEDKELYDPYDGDAKGVTHGHITVNISGGTIGSSAVNRATTSIGEVFAGCKGSSNLEKAHLFGLSKTTSVTISEKSKESPTHIYNTVYGGGEAGNVERGVAVEIKGGTIDKDVYGGGKKASTNILSKDLLTKDYNTTVNLHGGTIKGNVYGGGLGTAAIAAIVGGNVTVNMNKNNGCDGRQDTDNCVVQGTIFGCNNVNGTPRGNVEVNIYKTVGEKRAGTYELAAVYGGGNEAAYEPTDAYPLVYHADAQDDKYSYDYVAYTNDNGNYKPCTYNENTGDATIIPNGVALDDKGTKITALDDVFRANVNIYGCEKTSIGEVYGGGNAAPTPATRVTVNECFEIGSVFGGGNGAGEGNHGANVGYRDYYGQECDVPDLSYKATRKSNYSYGTGKAETKLYGGTIHQAFGGSNTLGNVREVAFSVLDQQNDCDLTVGEIYGAGNKAFMDAKIELDLGCIAGFKELFGGAYNANVNEDILLRVTSGTFNSVYGGNNVGGSINGTITVEVEETGCHPIIINDGLFGGGKLADYTAPEGRENSPIVRVKSATKIGNVYGGGFKANVTGNPTVEINMVNGVLYKDDDTHENVEQDLGTVNNVFGGGFEGYVKGNTTVLIGTKEGKSAQITGNVFGGGDNADVIGKTDVQIGYDDLKSNTQRTTDQ